MRTQSTLQCYSIVDSKLKFIVIHQDHLTKFLVLRPFDTKRKFATRLPDICLLSGVPPILLSDNGREFCNRVQEDLKTLWQAWKIMLGKSQRAVKRANQNIDNIRITKMKEIIVLIGV
jgi:hypothetical protein